MSDTSLPGKIVSKMYDADWFSQWLGIERVKVEEGCCILRMTIRKEMLNGFSIAHGGITYSLADSALAFASNSHGRMSVSIETSISHTVSLKEGDIITAVAEEISLSNKIGIYQVTVTNQKDETVALFKGTVYRTSKQWTVTDKRMDTNLRNVEEDSDKQLISNRPNEVKDYKPEEDLTLSDYRGYQIEKVVTTLDNGTKEDQKIIFPELSYKIVGSAFEIYNNLGGGHKEIVYQKALFEAFLSGNIKVKQQVFNPVKMKDKIIGKNYFDFLVEDKIVVEIKSSDKFSKSHYEQLLNYLIVSKLKLGILIVFGKDEVKYKRVLNFNLLNEERAKE